jgi:phosphoribosylanthranilate isomerase
LLGFVFAPSRRRIAVAEAAAIAKQVGRIGKVGVFVNSPAAVVREIAQVCQLDFVQLHGEESPDYCRSLNLPVIKAFRMAPDFTVKQLAGYDVDWLLLDSYVSGEAGGTGKTFDWQQAAQLIDQLTTPVIVAGGLTPENVTSAISCLKPQGVDVSGGVESTGSKDLVKIRRFIQAAHQTK